MIASKSGSYHVGQWGCSRVGGGFILAYHDLSDSDFERHVDALRPNQPVDLSELFDRVRTGRSTAGLFAITFDDGVADTVRRISAVCTRRGWPVTFYLPTAYLDDRRGLPFQAWARAVAYLPHAVLTLPSRTLDLSTDAAFEHFVQEIHTNIATQPRDQYQQLLDELAAWLLDRGLATADQLTPPEAITWAEVTSLSGDGEIRFESHGVTHTAVVALTPAMLKEELVTSKRRISERTNRECRHFCYPFGGAENIGSIAPRIVADVYDTAVTMSRGRLRGHPRWLLPRIPLYERDDVHVARLKILTV